MRTEVQRDIFLRKITSYRDQRDVIKVLTGIRRCGKSTLLQQYRRQLMDDGISEDRVVYINMESLSNIDYRDSLALYKHLKETYSGKSIYLMIDEVQNISGWEKMVASVMVDLDADVYVTGSNAYILSTELSTYLTGRSVQIRVLPLSFKEFCELYAPKDPMEVSETFDRYLRIGSMPFIRSEYPEDTVLERLEEIKSDIILKDVCNRKKTVSSVSLRRMIDYMFSEIGNAISAETLSKELGISSSTAHEYLALITDSLLFNEVKRYDLKGRTILKTSRRFYCTDIGMRNTQSIRTGRDRGRVYENLVYLELVRRGCKVYTGKLGDREIDFVAVRGDVTEYYQVSESVKDDDTYEREMAPFLRQPLNGRRYLLLMDSVREHEENGVMFVNLVDWLYKGE